MSFGERIKFRRGELKLSRGELAGRLGVSPSAVSNYENGLSFPKEDVMLQLGDRSQSTVSGQLPGRRAGAEFRRTDFAAEIQGTFPIGT